MPLLLPALISCTTAVEVVQLYRTGNELARRIIRDWHPRLKMEFDAIDLEEWRTQRKAAAQTRT